mmetsp:Transcript_17452/g.66012  ORF Transcript_17452/g.66012 Transcript_17452/m.66012 type:complete len:276 (-) Transcript_17452:1111-1938(-)
MGGRIPWMMVSIVSCAEAKLERPSSMTGRTMPGMIILRRMLICGMGVGQKTMANGRSMGHQKKGEGNQKKAGKTSGGSSFSGLSGKAPVSGSGKPPSPPPPLLLLLLESDDPIESATALVTCDAAVAADSSCPRFRSRERAALAAAPSSSSPSPAPPPPLPLAAARSPEMSAASSDESLGSRSSFLSTTGCCRVLLQIFGPGPRPSGYTSHHCRLARSRSKEASSGCGTGAATVTNPRLASFVVMARYSPAVTGPSLAMSRCLWVRSARRTTSTR